MKKVEDYVVFKIYFHILLLFFFFLGNTEGWSNVAPHESKEYISDFDWNKYDFTGRTFDSWTLRALQVDPMAEKYYGSSPYALWLNNPLRVIDPTGMMFDWYEDFDKSKQYDPNVKSQDDLQEGQKYLGETYRVKDSRGKVIEDYRADGSIMFANETSAYNRMWSQAIKNQHEVGGFTIENGDVIILPEYKNEDRQMYLEEYGYSISKNSTLSKEKELFKITSLIHTHQDPSGDPTPSTWDGNSYGDLGISKNMGGLPIMTIGHDGYIHAIYAPKNIFGYRSIPMGGLTREQLLKGVSLTPWLSKYPTLK